MALFSSVVHVETLQDLLGEALVLWDSVQWPSLLNKQLETVKQEMKTFAAFAQPDTSSRGCWE